MKPPFAPAPAASFAGHYDLLVAGASPGGISCALRAAREGLRVILLESSPSIGGMWTSGVQVFDTRYAGHRCPVLSEFVARLEDYYRRTCGEGSPAHTMARFGDPSRHGERPRFEPHVAEEVFHRMLAECPRVRLVCGWHPVEANVEDGVIRALSFRAREGADGIARVTADFYIDATYEADLAALTSACFRSGREGRAEFGEPHAGRHFTSIEPIGDVGVNLARKLNLHFFNRTSRRVFPESDGTADRAVQAYCVRLVLTDRPDNRVPVPRPAAYDRERYLGLLDRSPEAHFRRYPLSSHLLHAPIDGLRLAPNLPHGKMDWLGANFVGGNHDYPTASRARRRELFRAHVGHALGLLYFLQHDPAVPATVRAHVGTWGLARDEYRGSDHLPPAMYVRESRRLAGRHVFTEHDASRHPRHGRTPIRPDAMAFAEWPMDSHDCNPARQPGSCNDGEFILAEQTLPSQIPLRCLCCDEVENLLVTVCMSSTHVGWGTLRLEPVFVHVGEAAAVAALLCLRDRLAPRALAPAALQGALLKRGITTAYFSDVDLGRDDTWTRNCQFLGSRGFFAGYEAQPDRTVATAVLAAWENLFARWLRGQADADNGAARVAAAEGVLAGAVDADLPRREEDAAALLRRHGWKARPGATVRESAQVLASALGEADSVPLST
jgi:hypothetical protein